MKKILACIPLSWDVIFGDFFYSCHLMQRQVASKYDFSIVTTNAPYLDMMRQQLVNVALAHKPDYILWLDADQTYPPETPEILINHIDDGKLVVGGVTPHRGTRRPLIYDFNEEGGVIYRDNVKLKNGLIKVGGMGFGGVMMNPDVFNKVDGNCFKMYWHEKFDTKVGEDVVFYNQCKEKNIDVWCDTDLLYDHLMTRGIGFAENLLLQKDNKIWIPN